MIKRQKVALVLFSLFLITRALDIYSTWIFTPDLSMEGNPLIVILAGNSLLKWLAMQLFSVLICLWFCYRIAYRNYNESTYDERIINKLFHTKPKTAKKRFIHESAPIVMFIIAGLVAFISNSITEGFGSNLVNRFVALGFIKSLLIVLAVGSIVGLVVMKKIVNHYLKNDLTV